MKWKKAWQEPSFRHRLITGLFILTAVLLFFPYFFGVIDKRKGSQLSDWALDTLPAYDLSIPIFVIIWVMTIFIIIRCAQSPPLFNLFLWSYIFLCLSRIITISLVALAPPAGLIELKDPVTNIFYGGEFISTDLFYSGHTATQFLLFLCLQKRRERLLALVSTVLVGLMVLIQHVHYFIDVISAPLFSYLAYRLAVSVCSSPMKQFSLFKKY
ncbi:MAG: phosphatase PAP2-related protein [Chitinophagaceae bacterium]